MKESKEVVEARLKKNQEEYERTTGTMALGDGAVAKRLAKEAAESQIEKIRADNQVFSATFVKARQEALDKIQKINDDKSLSDDEKNKLLAPLREKVNKSYLEPAQKLVDDLSSRKTQPRSKLPTSATCWRKRRKRGTPSRFRSYKAASVGIRSILKLLLRS